MAVISVSLPDDLLDRSERFMQERGLDGRSALVRTALREYLHREQVRSGNGHREATLTALYPVQQEAKVAQLRRGTSTVVSSMAHGHGGDALLEVYILSGADQELRAFADGLRGIRDVGLVDLTYTDLDTLAA